MGLKQLCNTRRAMQMQIDSLEAWKKQARARDFDQSEEIPRTESIFKVATSGAGGACGAGASVSEEEMRRSKRISRHT